ncbi:hypothetical protein [uncultured Methanomethylovorans sp.]|uniref:hypothetical protein n=1 Tax=uncultured Methanomethylovorans sp. TaxID=183759 RepID=UPI002AA60425|nr:hypothetical protein [uncultured Methanomethylovorans sp.]
MIFGNGASNAEIDFLENIQKPAERVLRTGYQDLLYEDEEKIVQLWNKLEETRDVFEENTSVRLSSDEYKHIESKFALARLKLATVLYKKGNFPNISRRFNETELGLFKIIEEFRFFDDYTIDEIKERIGRKEGKIYDIVKDNVEKMDSHRDSIFENVQIKPAIARAIKDLLKDRTEKIQEAIIEYIRTNPGGITRTVIEMESAIKKVLESEEKRQEISADVQMKLDRLGEELESAKKAALRKEELDDKLVQLEKQMFQKELQVESLNDRIRGMENERSKIFDLYSETEKRLEIHEKEIADKKKELELKESEINGLKSSLRSEMESENKRIIEEELSKLEQLKQDLQTQADVIESEKQAVRFQKEEITEKFESIRKAIEGSSTVNRFIPADLAKLYEMDYIGRFDMKMYSFPIEIRNPINGKNYKVTSWNGDHTKTDDKYKIHELLKDSLTVPEIESQLPLNIRSRYEIKERTFRIFGKKEPKTVVEAIIFNHWKEYAMNGFDTKSVTLSELNGILVHAINNAEKGKYFHLICIVSPTGWDSKIKTYLQSEEFSKNYVSRYISLCLVDSETGELLYNKTDERIKDYIKLFEPETDLEKVIKCKRLIKNEYEFADHVILDKFVEETKMDARIVRKALHELEAEGYGQVLYVSGVGLVLNK